MKFGINCPLVASPRQTGHNSDFSLPFAILRTQATQTVCWQGNNVGISNLEKRRFYEKEPYIRSIELASASKACLHSGKEHGFNNNDHLGKIRSVFKVNMLKIDKNCKILKTINTPFITNGATKEIVNVVE